MSVGISIGAAIGIGGVVGAGANIASGIIQSHAAGAAADVQLQANRETIQAQKDQAAQAEQFLREQAAQTRSDLEPFRNSQLSAMGKLQGLTDPNSPVYQQQRDLATKAIQRQLASQGLLRSNQQGSQLSQLELGLALQRTGILQSLAGGNAGDQYAGVSSNLGTGLATVSGNLGAQIGSSFQNAGAITANNINNQAGAFSGSLAGVNNSIQGIGGQLINLNLQNKLLQSLGGGGFGGGPGLGGNFNGGIDPMFARVA